MIKALNAAQMRACDAAAIDEYGVPGLVLMENAGVQVLEAMLEHFGGEPPLATAVLCGRGNNGGDGLVVARHLHNLGREVVVYLFGSADGLKPDPAVNHAIAVAMDLPIVPVTDSSQWTALAGGLGNFDCIVDAMLGTGLESGARGLVAEAIATVNGTPVPVVAVDVPSGLSSDHGDLLGVAMEADLTVTFAAPKCCHLLSPAADYCGELAVVDIGIPERVLDRSDCALWLVTPGDLEVLLQPRPVTAHKGDYGRLLIVAGSLGMAGAAVLAARAAVRAGAGLVHVACPASVYEVVAAQLVEPLVHPLPAGEDGGFAAGAAAPLRELVSTADAVAVGPGLGRGDATMTLVREIVTNAEMPVVVDADGLHALATAPELLDGLPADRVLTPHPGEMARLLRIETADVQADRPGIASGVASRSGATVVLKGHRTIAAAPGRAPAVNPTGNPGLATGGTGDVLTGMIGTYLAGGIDPWTATICGVFLHGLAADRIASRIGQSALAAGDLTEEIGPALESLRDEARP